MLDLSHYPTMKKGALDDLLFVEKLLKKQLAL